MERRDADDIPSIVVVDLYANGRPREFASPVVRVAKERHVTTRVALVPYGSGVECTYKQWVDARPTLEGRYVIHVTKSYPHFGGHRLWFRCSRESCARRSGRLFLVDLLLVCRECARVRYLSQRHPKPRHVQQVERAEAIRTQLGGRPVLGDPMPERPKGMHHATYERLRQKLLEIEWAEDKRVTEEAVISGEITLADVLLDEYEKRSRERRDTASSTDTEATD